MNFNEWWDTLLKPLRWNQKGYKKGAMDGWEACLTNSGKQDLHNIIAQQRERIETLADSVLHGLAENKELEKINNDDDDLIQGLNIHTVRLERRIQELKSELGREE